MDIEVGLVVQMVNNPPTMLEIQIQSLGQVDTLEKGMATHSSIFTGDSMDRGARQAVVHRVAKSWT